MAALGENPGMGAISENRGKDHMIFSRTWLFILGMSVAAHAAVVGSVHGLIHDPQHRPVQDAMVMIKAKNSDWAATVNSDSGEISPLTPYPSGNTRLLSRASDSSRPSRR